MKIGLGTVGFGTAIAPAQANKLMDSFLESGGKVIDTANNYAYWQGKGDESETVIGMWLTPEKRQQVEIHTKVGAMPADGKNLETAEGLSKGSIEQAVQGCLQRLSSDYIDVLYAHIDDPSTPLLEFWSTFSALVDKGVVKRLGISNFSLARVQALQAIIDKHGLAPISYAQYRYSVIAPVQGAELGVQRCFDREMIETFKAASPNIQLVAYSPLLEGAFEVGGKLPEAYQSVTNQAAVEAIREQAEQQGVTPSALVLKMLAEQGIMPLTATSKLERLAANMQCFMDIKLAEEVV